MHFKENLIVLEKLNTISTVLPQGYFLIFNLIVLNLETDLFYHVPPAMFCGTLDLDITAIL